MASGVLGLVYGLCSAVSWGSGDFFGGYACRRINMYAVVLFSQLCGFVALLLLAWVFHETAPSIQSLGMAGIAGIAGALGLAALYSGLASGRMGIVAPFSAVIAAILPVVASFFTEGPPPASTMAGFGLALLAVWLLTRTTQHEPVHAREISLSLLAGTGFGLFFILMGHTHEFAVMWPLVAARVASISVFFVVATLRQQREIPGPRHLPAIVAAGLLDAGGNAFFVLASQIGRVDISAVLASLYPAATVILARFILQEHLRPYQWGGIITALLAILCIAL